MAVLARRPLGVLMMGLASTAVLTACSGTPDPALPAYSGTSAAVSSGAPSGTSATTRPTDEQAVVTALDAYTTAVDTFVGGRELDMASLREVAAEPFATQIGKNILSTKAAGFRTVGTTVTTVSSVIVAGSAATITACLDATGVHTVANTATSTAGAGTGKATRSTFTLARASGVWLVSGVRAVGPCQ